MELVVPVDGGELPATLTMPSGSLRAGVVVLHGAEAGQRSYFLYEHLADLLEPEGVAVLRYDRRTAVAGQDVPLPIQAADALAGARLLREIAGGAPTGLWGFSQGAWAASLAAVTDADSVAFLICVSYCGVSPAEQMRIGCARELAKHGYDDADIADLTAARLITEQFLRDGRDRRTAQALLDAAATRPWFPLAYLPSTLPEPGSWPDMDFDPRPALAELTCPVLAFYGEHDEWMPIEPSIDAWHTAKEQGTLTDLTVQRLPGTDHLPTEAGRPDTAAISAEYSEALTGWLRSIHTRVPRSVTVTGCSHGPAATLTSAALRTGLPEER